MACVRLWIRTDGEQPKAVAEHTRRAPGPGALVDVEARSAEEARAVFKLYGSEEPNRKTDREGWLSWDEARVSVRSVTT